VTALNAVLPLASSTVSFIFAAMVLLQWRAKRRSFQLVWAVGLTWYGISSGAEFVGAAAGWNQVLYRLWYLTGALYVAAFLGAGTVYLLRRSRFGYFAAASIFLGGLLALAAVRRYPGSELTGRVTALAALSAAIAVAYTTARDRRRSADVVMGFLAGAAVVVAVLVLTAPLGSPGYAVDPVTQVPVGNAMPNRLRVLSGPFNVAGALCLVFGGLFSAYVYMPKRKLMRGRHLPPVAAQLYGATAIAVNLVASLPGAAVALVTGRLNSRVPATMLIAAGGFIPSITSGLNRFGVTWSFFLGELVGVLLIFIGFLVSEEVFASARLLGRTPARARTDAA
jgi:hypothetical protein